MLCRKDKKEADGPDLYIGSTSQPLEGRLSTHKSDAMRQGNENNRLHKRMREIGLQDWKMVPLLTFACDQKTIFEFEGQWIGIIGPGLNTNSPIREEETREEYKANYSVKYYGGNKEKILQQQATYRESHKDARKEYSTRYYENNKETILHQNAVYRKNNKETISQWNAVYRDKNKEALKEYRESHKDVKKEYDVAYREKNKEKILQKKALREEKSREERRFYCSVCELACVSKRDLERHLDTLRHSYAWLNSLD